MTSKIKLSDLPIIELTNHDCDIIASAINFCGSDGHPAAVAEHLDCFDLDYLLDCLDKGIEKANNEAFKEEVTELWCNINMAKEEKEGAAKIAWQEANNSVNANDPT